MKKFLFGTILLVSCATINEQDSSKLGKLYNINTASSLRQYSNCLVNKFKKNKKVTPDFCNSCMHFLIQMSYSEEVLTETRQYQKLL